MLQHTIAAAWRWGLVYPLILYSSVNIDTNIVIDDYGEIEEAFVRQRFARAHIETLALTLTSILSDDFETRFSLGHLSFSNLGPVLLVRPTPSTFVCGTVSLIQPLGCG
jgi:hypothetical protein